MKLQKRTEERGESDKDCTPSISCCGTQTLDLQIPCDRVYYQWKIGKE
jgi:hypothetical protein